MGNRKQPFGNRVVMGEIALHPQESKLVTLRVILGIFPALFAFQIHLHVFHLAVAFL